MTFVLGWPQIIMLGLIVIGLGVHAVKHDQPREDTYNFWGRLLNDTIMIAILVWGGFF